MKQLRQTPSQTVGPFFAYGLTAEQYGYPYDSLMNHSLVSNDTPGERIFITGRIFDGNGVSIPDALIELWQADPQGHYRTTPIEHNTASFTDRGFLGFGRMGTGTLPDGQFRFTTLKPGALDDGSAPHINIMLLMRGSLRNLYTRLYFPDEPAANAQDALLNAVSPDRRATLLAHRQEVNGETRYVFDIYMQGPNETVFFDL
ncbi:protocatechuate 3,4-dioxygenase subunit alpha [Spirosoma areae]